jgi:D-alanine transaminase
LPVTSIDGHKVGDGKPGPVTMKVRERYLAALERQVRAARGRA